MQEEVFSIEKASVLSEAELFSSDPVEAAQSLVVISGQNFGGEPFSLEVLSKVKAVIAESFDSKCRGALIEQGIMPLVFKLGMKRASLSLENMDHIELISLKQKMRPGMDFLCSLVYQDQFVQEFFVTSAIENHEELRAVMPA